MRPLREILLAMYVLRSFQSMIPSDSDVLLRDYNYLAEEELFNSFLRLTSTALKNDMETMDPWPIGSMRCFDRKMFQRAALSCRACQDSGRIYEREWNFKLPPRLPPVL